QRPARPPHNLGDAGEDRTAGAGRRCSSAGSWRVDLIADGGAVGHLDAAYHRKVGDLGKPGRPDDDRSSAVADRRRAELVRLPKHVDRVFGILLRQLNSALDDTAVAEDANGEGHFFLSFQSGCRGENLRPAGTAKCMLAAGKVGHSRRKCPWFTGRKWADSWPT